jgi:hypothetical protein
VGIEKFKEPVIPQIDAYPYAIEDIFQVEPSYIVL